MEIDDAIVQLGAKLDAWLDGNLATISSMDRVAQFKAILTGVEITKELDLLKAKGVAAITALLDRQDAIAEDERVASLVRTFVFAAKLAATLSDELMDTNGYNKVTGLMIGIANALDATGSGRAALAVLLDNADNRVRAFAGVYLIRFDARSCAPDPSRHRGEGARQQCPFQCALRSPRLGARGQVWREARIIRRSRRVHERNGPCCQGIARSPDGAQRNPGLPRGVNAAPDFAALHPGYKEKKRPRLTPGPLDDRDDAGMSAPTVVGEKTTAPSPRAERDRGRRARLLR